MTDRSATIDHLWDLAAQCAETSARDRLLAMAYELAPLLSRDTSQLQYGPGSQLWTYWTKGKGLARWAGAVHKWTTLHRLLIEEGVPAHMADGLTTNIIMAVMPTYMKTHGKT